MSPLERLLTWWLTAPPEVSRWFIWAELVFAAFLLLGLLAWLWAIRAARLLVLAAAALAAWRWLTGRDAADDGARRRGVRGGRRAPRPRTSRS